MHFKVSTIVILEYVMEKTALKQVKKPKHEGKYAPQDLAFQCDITQVKDSYDSSKAYYIYLKPISANPIKQIRLDSSRCG